jgi:nitronate monooxygenase
VVLDRLAVPIVLAPLAGGPSTPELAAAVSEAGGLGFLGTGYLTADAAREQLDATRRLTARPFGANVFVPGAGPTDPAVYEAYVASLGERAGEPRYSDDEFDAKVELLVDEPVAVVSFTFGCPPREVIDRLRAAGSEVWITVTSPEEAAIAVGAGADALVVQGAEAGGHRGSFEDRDDLPVYGLLALLQLVGAEQGLPLVATGGIATARGVEAVLAGGARAAQIGTAFMLCPEAGTSAPHREAIRSDRETALTRAFSGRLARGIRNAFLDEHSAAAPIAYPEIHYATAPMRKAARESGDASVINLWAGEAHSLAREAPAAEIVRELSGTGER